MGVEPGVAQPARGIAIDAQFQPGPQVGGVQTQLAALVHALGQLDGPERYLVVTRPDGADWLQDELGPNQRTVFGPTRTARYAVRQILGAWWPPLWGAAQRAWLRFARDLGADLAPPGCTLESRAFYQRLGVAVVHVFHQSYVRTGLPVVFNPHDLQHEHFPEFFPPEVLARRRYIYRKACEEAAAVVAASWYTRDDVIARYHISSDKVWIIPLAPATAAYEAVSDAECEETLNKHAISTPFMFYPAATWEHKNHLRLLEAVVKLRRQGLDVHLVCTGAQLEPSWSKIMRFVTENTLDSVVRFLGFVPRRDLRALYTRCQFVVTPSLFEQASGPMFEAWQEGAPVAASNVTSLPEQAAGAALLFDPYSVEAIADAILRMSTDGALRRDLQRRGRVRLADFSWERTAKAYRALYRLLGRWPLTDEDRYLLGWDWMRDPRPSSCPTL